jgi:hypothetical protein
MGVGSLLACVLSLVFLRSPLKTVRRGLEETGTFVAGAGLGALFGLGAWVLICVLTSKEPMPLFGIGCAIAGAIAVVAAMRATAAETS